jgi:hypothetical protein
VHQGVNIPHVVTLVNAIAMATEGASADDAERMLAIVLAGIASR